MCRRAFILLATLASITVALPAQQAAGGAAQRLPSTAPVEAEQFAFLVGQWEVTVTPKVNSLAARIHGSPTFVGSWKAWRAFDRFGVEDELRIMDRSGNPNNLTHTMRFYDAAQSKWTLTALDVYRGRYVSAVGEMKAGELVVTSVGKDGEGKSYVQRARFFEITPTSFKYQADRYMNDEKKWDTAVLTMDARRVAAVAPR